MFFMHNFGLFLNFNQMLRKYIIMSLFLSPFGSISLFPCRISSPTITSEMDSDDAVLHSSSDGFQEPHSVYGKIILEKSIWGRRVVKSFALYMVIELSCGNV